MSDTEYEFSGRKLWESKDSGKIKIQVDLPPDGNYIFIEGTFLVALSSFIAVTDIELFDMSCAHLKAEEFGDDTPEPSNCTEEEFTCRFDKKCVSKVSACLSN